MTCQPIQRIVFPLSLYWSVDFLFDGYRFRTLFPEEYIRLYDAKKTTIPKKYQGRTLPLLSTPFEKVQGRRSRRPFRPDEDVALKRGVEHVSVFL